MIYSLLRQLINVFTWFVVIAPWEQAIRVRMGNSVRTLHAGWYVRIPFADRIFKQSIRRRLNILKPQTLTTTDRHVITCAGAVGYAIGDLLQLYNTLESANDTIDNEVSSIVARFIGSRSISECTSPALELFVRENLNLSKYGLIGQEFYTTSFATSKTYRFITGDMSSWATDERLSMREFSHNNQPPQ